MKKTVLFTLLGMAASAIAPAGATVLNFNLGVPDAPFTNGVNTTATFTSNGYTITATGYLAHLALRVPWTRYMRKIRVVMNRVSG